MHVGLDRVEAGEGFVRTKINPSELIQMANDRNLQVQFELGEKHAGAFDGPVVDGLIRQGLEWLNAGAKQLVIEARESALGVGLFDDGGRLNEKLAKRFMDSFGEDHVVFEAPVKKSQFALLDFFGPGVYLGNVRLEELLRVEIYRRCIPTRSPKKTCVLWALSRLREPPCHGSSLIHCLSAPKNTSTNGPLSSST